MADHDTPVMTEAESLVSGVLLFHCGRENAITADAIGRLTGISPRAVRAHIRRLRMVFGEPIGSITAKPPGFYTAASAEELSAVAETWRRFGIRNLVMAANLLKITKRELLDQVAIDFDRELRS